MKTIGLIGGTSWTSTIDYYRYANEEVSQRLGGLHSAKLVLVSVDFAELEHAMHSNQWEKATSILTNAGTSLDRAGVDVVLLCSNLIHKMYDDVQTAVPIPLLHIGDAIAGEIAAQGYKTVALLGAKPTMEEAFYKSRIQKECGATILTPSDDDRAFIDEAIFSRMCRDIYTDEDRTRMISIIDGLKAQGAEAVILGCTELPVLLKEASLPLLNSTRIHARAAVAEALKL